MRLANLPDLLVHLLAAVRAQPLCLVEAAEDARRLRTLRRDDRPSDGRGDVEAGAGDLCARP
jgi:hypothetical protein